MLTPKFLFCGPQCAESVELSVVAVGGVNGEIAMSRREMTVGCCSATVGAPPYSFLRCCFNWLGRSGSSKMHNATRVDWRRRRRRSNFGDFGRRKWGPWRSSWLMPFEMPLVHPLRRLPFNFCDNPSRIGRSRVDWTRRRRRSSFGELWAPRRGHLAVELSDAFWNAVSLWPEDASIKFLRLCCKNSAFESELKRRPRRL